MSDARVLPRVEVCGRGHQVETKPPRKNFLQQQAKFDQFIQESITSDLITCGEPRKLDAELQVTRARRRIS